MWHESNGGFTDDADLESGTLDIPKGDPLVEFFVKLEGTRWSRFFEVISLPEQNQFLAAQHGGFHSRTERLFMDAIWAVARFHLEGGGISPLAHSTTSAFFEQLTASNEPDDADALVAELEGAVGSRASRRAVPGFGVTGALTGDSVTAS